MSNWCCCATGGARDCGHAVGHGRIRSTRRGGGRRSGRPRPARTTSRRPALSGTCSRPLTARLRRGFSRSSVARRRATADRSPTRDVDWRTPRRWIEAEVELAAPRFIVVDDGTASGMVPFTVVDPNGSSPTGNVAERRPRDVPQPPRRRPRAAAAPADEPTAAIRGVAGVEDVIGAHRGAIPWRRYLAAVRGLGAELERERHVQRGLRFCPREPGQAGRALEAPRRRVRQPQVHRGRPPLRPVRDRTRARPRAASSTVPTECVALLDDARTGIGRRRAELLADAGDRPSGARWRS